MSGITASAGEAAATLVEAGVSAVVAVGVSAVVAVGVVSTAGVAAGSAAGGVATGSFWARANVQTVSPARVTRASFAFTLFLFVPWLSCLFLRFAATQRSNEF